MMTDAFSTRLKSTRLAQGLTQQELAERLGVHVMVISRYERGTMLPSADSLSTLADVLDVSADYLLGRSEDMRGMVNESSLPPKERALLDAARRHNTAYILRFVTDIIESRGANNEESRKGLDSLSGQSGDEGE